MSSKKDKLYRQCHGVIQLTSIIKIKILLLKPTDELIMRSYAHLSDFYKFPK